MEARFISPKLVFDLLMQNLSRVEIAEKLECSVHTVNHKAQKYIHPIKRIVDLGTKDESYSEEMYFGVLPVYSLEELSPAEKEILSEGTIHRLEYGLIGKHIFEKK